MIVLQIATGGRYNSPLIEERFQILEGLIRGTYYIVDHDKPNYGPDLPKGVHNSFRTAFEAEGWIKNILSTPDARGNSPRSDISERSTAMPAVAKSTRAKVVAPPAPPPDIHTRKPGRPRKAATVEDKAPPVGKPNPLAPKPQLVRKIDLSPIPEKATPRDKSKAPKVVKFTGPDPHNPDGTKKKVGVYTQELILSGLDNDDVVRQLKTTYPERANSLSNVVWYRSYLRREGKLPGEKYARHAKS